MPDPGRMRGCIKLDNDCADICGLAVFYVARGSAYAADVLRLCITVCDACHVECGRHDHGHCEKCAAICAECSDACRAYLDQLR
jgi:hypothetical protein